MRNKGENIQLIFMFLVLIIGIGYAYLNSNLNIIGTSEIGNVSWDVYWDNIVFGNNNVTDITTPATISQNKTEVSFNVNFSKPGDTYEFTVDAVNDGSIDAMVETVSQGVYASNGTTPKSLPDYLEYTVTYSDGTTIKSNDLLPVNGRKAYKVRVHYKEDITSTQLPSTNDNYVFKFSVTYIQADDSVPSAQATVVTFMANGGQGEMSSQTIPANTQAALTKNTFTRAGYLFNGWNTNSNGTGTKYRDEEEVSNLGEITLYAEWKVDQFPYVFRQDGECTFNGSSDNITGENCTNYTNSKYIDTGIKLYSETNKSKDYEIGFTIEEYVPANNVDQATLMNTKYESTGYPGVVFRKNSNTDFELASRKTSSSNEFYRFAAAGVKDIRIYRINNEIYYKIDDGERTLLNNLTQYNPTFDLNVWFGAAPTNASATTAQRYFTGKMSNMYIRLGTYVDEGTYTIILNPNGGTVSPEFINVTAGSPIGTLPTPEKELHNFLGWYTNLTNGVEVTSSYIPDGEMTIFAKWQKKPTYSITFEEDGGEEVEDKEIEQGSSVGELPIPVKTGKSFDGWYLESTYTTKVTSSYVPTGNVILYAKWSTTTFPIVFEQTGACTFNGSSGTITGENCSTYVGQKYIDTGISLYSEENKSKDYEIGFTIDSYTPSNNESRATLMNTKLEATGYPGVVFRRNDATDNFVLQSRKTSSANEQKTFAYNTVTSVVVYRISNEIYYSINGGEKTLLNNLTEYNPTFNLTTWFGAAPSNEAGTSAQRYLTGTLSNMYIKLGTYEEVGKYKVTYNTNGGEEISPSYIYINQGAPIGYLPTLNEREWYTFEGWYTDISSGIEVDENYIPTGNITIYARWTEIPSYTITLNPNNGNSPETRRVVQGAAIGELPTLTRGWYKFEGWYTGLTNGIEIDENFIPANSMEIFARWSEFSGETTIVTGKEFNTAIKQLVINSSASYTSGETSIATMMRNATPPTPKQLEKSKIVSTENSIPIYIWVPEYNSYNSTLYYYTTASKIYYNEDSSFMFSNFSRLWEIGDFDSYDTSRVKNMSHMFDNVGNVVTTGFVVDEFQIDLSDWDTSKVTDMSYMFSSLTVGAKTWNIGDLSDWNTSEVTNMSHMFENAGSKALIWNVGNLNNWNTSKVTDMSSMFSDVGYSATTLNIGDLSRWNTQEVTNMSSMFRSAGRNATTWSIGDISEWNTSKVTDMSSMFSGAGYSATTWNIGDLSRWNTQEVTNMSSMFRSAGRNATTWSIGDISEWNTSKVTDMSSMFSGAGYSATTWNIGDLSIWNTQEVTNMYSMFNYAGYSATTWYIGNLNNWNTTKVTYMSSMFNYAGYSATTWNIGDLSIWNTQEVTNMSNMFSNAGYSATTWDIGNLNNWNTTKVTKMAYMFNNAGHNAATWSIGDISEWNTSTVTDMSSMFSSAGYSDTTWDIGNLSSWNTSNVTNMDHMFFGAGYNSSTFSLDLSGWNTSKVTNMRFMFQNAGCNSSTFSLDLSGWNTSNATDILVMFVWAGRNSTTWSVTIPPTNGNGISNTTSRIYGQTAEIYEQPDQGRQFTLAAS